MMAAASTRRSMSPPRVDLHMPADSEVHRYDRNLRSPKADRMRWLRQQQQQQQHASPNYYSPNASLFEESIFIDSSFEGNSGVEDASITDTLLSQNCAESETRRSYSTVPELIECMKSSSIADSIPPTPAHITNVIFERKATTGDGFQDMFERSSDALQPFGSSSQLLAAGGSSTSLLRGGSSQLSSPSRLSRVRAQGSRMQRVCRVRIAAGGEEAEEARCKLHRLESMLRDLTDEPRVLVADMSHRGGHHGRLLSRLRTPPKSRIGSKSVKAVNKATDEVNAMIADCSNNISNASAHRTTSFGNKELAAEKQAAKKVYTVDRRAAHPLSQRELDAHESDLANFDSMIVYADWRFREVRRQERERYGEGPTRLKLAVAADLLKKLMKGMGSYAHVVGELVDELLSSVIVDYAKHAKPKMKLNDFLKLDNYFDLYETARDDLDEFETEMSLVHQGASMKTLIKKSVAGAYNTHILFIRDACFFSWKARAATIRRQLSYFKKQHLRSLFRRMMQFTALSRLANGRPVAYRPSYGLDPSTFDMVKTVPQLKEQSKVNVGLEMKSVQKKVDIAMKARAQVSTCHMACQTPTWETLEIAGRRVSPTPQQSLEREEELPEEALEASAGAQAARKPKRKERKEKKGHVAHGSRAKQVLDAHKMTVDIALQLVSYVYESKLVSGAQDPSLLNFEKYPLMDSAREAMGVRYGIKELALKHLNGLILCTKQEGRRHKRMRLFAELCGIKRTKKDSGVSDPRYCRFFFDFLRECFPNLAATKMVSATFNSKSKEIDRQVVIDAARRLFVNITARAVFLFDAFEKKVLSLPPTLKLDKSRKVYRVNIDEALFIVMDYYKFERSIESHSVSLIDAYALIQRFLIRWKRRRVARGTVAAPLEEEAEEEDMDWMADDMMHLEDDESVQST